MPRISITGTTSRTVIDRNSSFTSHSIWRFRWLRVVASNTCAPYSSARRRFSPPRTMMSAAMLMMKVTRKRKIPSVNSAL